MRRHSLKSACAYWPGDDSNTFGGTHYVSPRQVTVEVRYRFHY